MDLCDYDIDVLRMLDGQDQDRVNGWGAALSSSLGTLKRRGFVKQSMTPSGLEYQLTEKGRQAIKQ